MMSLTILAAVAALVLAAVGLSLSRLYRKTDKETAFVRTGLGGARVVTDGGTLVVPIFQQLTAVSLKTHKLVVTRTREQALITQDKLRADVVSEFYVRIRKDEAAIQQAAESLGARVNDTEALKELVEGKFVSALRSVAATMRLEDLHQKRQEFVQQVREAAADDLIKNGLELESAALVALDQTDQSFFNPDNAFDAEGLRKIKEITEKARKERVDIEASTNIGIEERRKNERADLLRIQQEQREAELAQERQIANAKAAADTEKAAAEARAAADMARSRAEAKRDSEAAEIEADRAARLARAEADLRVREAEIANSQALELRRQEQERAVADASRTKSAAEAEAARARADAVRAAEEVKTVAAVAEANRGKDIALVKASEEAERERIAKVTAAESEAEAAQKRADGTRAEAQARADAERLLAEATAERLLAEARGEREKAEALNALRPEIRSAEARLALIQRLPEIIAAMAEPISRIESVRVVDVVGAGSALGERSPGGGSDGRERGGGGADGGFPQQVVDAVMRHRVQSGFVDALLREAGMAQVTPEGALRAAGAGLALGAPDAEQPKEG